MLGKLIKYEFKATGRMFLPLYALLLVFALINKFFIVVNTDSVQYLRIPQVIAASVYGVIIVGICVMTLIVTIQRFNRNLLSDEGYLSFTLPVKAHTHIDCKMIVSFVWSVLSVLISLLSVYIMALDSELIRKTGEMFFEVVQALNKVGASGYVILLELLIAIVVTSLSGILSIYAAIAIGSQSSKHKLLVAFGAYLIFGVVEQIVVSVFVSAFGNSMESYFRTFFGGPVEQAMGGVQLILLLVMIYFLVFGAIFYFLTNWMLQKKLNLE